MTDRRIYRSALIGMRRRTPQAVRSIPLPSARRERSIWPSVGVILFLLVLAFLEQAVPAFAGMIAAVI